MKVLSIKKSYATLIAKEYKLIKTISWKLNIWNYDGRYEFIKKVICLKNSILHYKILIKLIQFVYYKLIFLNIWLILWNNNKFKIFE